MYVVLVEFTIAANYFEDFLARVERQARDSLEKEQDCRVFDVCTSDQRADFVLLYEVYTDAAAFRRHLDSAHFHDFDRAVAGWVLDKQVSTYRRR